MDWQQAMVMFLLGLPCGLVAVTAGGGVTLGVPLLMLIGLPAATSVVMTKVALWASFLTGSLAHARQGDGAAVRLPWWMWALCLLAAMLGSQGLVALDPRWMRSIVLSMLILSIGVTAWAMRAKQGEPVAPSVRQRQWGYWVVVALAAYSGFFGAGYGVFLIWALTALHGHSPSSAAALGTRLALMTSSVAVVVFALKGAVPWLATLPLAVGCAVGGLLGAWATRRLGDRFIRVSMWAVSLLVAVKLLLD